MTRLTSLLSTLSRDGSRPWRLGRLAICLAAAQLIAACASTPEEPVARKDALPESYYVVAPWARKPPVGITGHFNAVNAALAGVQHSIDSYYAGVKAQADAYNSRVFMRAELARAQAEEQKREEARRAAQAKLQAQAGSPGTRFKTAKIGHIAPYNGLPPWAGFQAGTYIVGYIDSVKGWGDSIFAQAHAFPGAPPPEDPGEEE